MPAVDDLSTPGADVWARPDRAYGHALITRPVSRSDEDDVDDLGDQLTLLDGVPVIKSASKLCEIRQLVERDVSADVGDQETSGAQPRLPNP